MTEIDVLERLLADRWSCRAFTDEPVDPETIERLLLAAQRSPSWCNTQPWHLVVLSGDATAGLRDALAANERLGSDIPFPRSYEGVYAERRRQSGWQLYDAVGIAKGDRAASAAQMKQNFAFFGAPHVAILSTTASLGPYGAIDCGLYIQTFLLAAHALGLGACAQAALAMHAELLRKHLGLDADRQVVCGISFGYPDLNHPANSYRTSRAELEEAVVRLGQEVGV